MPKTLILMFHPDLTKSRVNTALAAAARDVPGTMLIDMQSVYPDGQIDMFTDGAAEAAQLIAADAIVLQFPVQWYSTPPLLKAWQDAVLTRMFYVNAATEGMLLAGKLLMIAATAGNVATAYGPSGANLFVIDDIFIPLRATAHRCGLIWQKPFVLFNAGNLDDAARATAAHSYAARITNLAAHMPSWGTAA